MTRPWQTIASVATREGALELRRRGDDDDARADFLIVIGGRVLMTSAARRSEERLATLACAGVKAASPRVLVGGLGMGYTLRAALDALPRAARVTVAELNGDVVGWCRGPLAAATAGALADRRVEVVVGDVARVIASAGEASLDAIILDLYEGPYASTQRRDDPFYGAAALARTRAALVPGGVFAVWAEDHDAAFVRRCITAGFDVAVHREGRGGRTHIVYLGTRKADPRPTGARSSGPEAPRPRSSGPRSSGPRSPGSRSPGPRSPGSRGRGR